MESIQYLLIFSLAFIKVITYILEKKIEHHKIHPEQLLVYLSVLGFIVSFIYCILRQYTDIIGTKESLRLIPSFEDIGCNLWLLLIISCLALTGTLLYLYILGNYAFVKPYIYIHGLEIILALILGSVVFKETLSLKNYVAIGVIFLGLLLLSH